MRVRCAQSCGAKERPGAGGTGSRARCAQAAIFYFDVNKRLAFETLWPGAWWVEKPGLVAWTGAEMRDTLRKAGFGPSRLPHVLFGAKIPAVRQYHLGY